MKREFSFFLEDILESISLIKSSPNNLTKDRFLKSRDIQDATARRLEIIGEAVKHIPPKIREKYPDIPWKDISSTRDVLSHAYFEINLPKIWKIIELDLPLLERQIMEIKEKECPS